MCRFMVIIQDGNVHLLQKLVRDFLLNLNYLFSINKLQAYASLINKCIEYLLENTSLLEE